MTQVVRIALAVALSAATTAAVADDFRVRTDIGLTSLSGDVTSLNAALGFDTAQGASTSARLMYEGADGPWRYAVHGALGFSTGDTVALANMAGGAALPPTLYDLSLTWLDTADQLGSFNIDRAWVSYTTEHVVIKLGRQAITWGSGQVFHPSDFVAPFAPSAIDTSYKPGADMLYLQYLFDNGADIQAIAVPRTASYGGPISDQYSTYAVRAAASLGMFDATLSFGQDHGDRVAAIGLGGPLGGASWNAEYVGWMLAGGGNVPSWLVNLSMFGTLGNWNAAYFAEYYHNGFGTDASVSLDALPAALTKRMAANQVFFAGTDFLALGASLQMSPELSATPSLIVSLDDNSAMAGLAVNYSYDDNTDFSFHLSVPIGDDGTEFGGRETSAGSSVFIGLPLSIGLRTIRYF